MPFYLLLAMQAAGMVTDYFGSKNQNELMNMGMKIQQAGIEANLQETRAAAADESLQAMIQLRKNLGSQIAVFAARGTSTGAGSAASILNEAQSNFNTDEKIRRLNLLGKTNQLRANAAISRLQNSSDVTKLWQGFASRNLNRFPSSISGWKQAIADLNEGFGLTSIQ